MGQPENSQTTNCPGLDEFALLPENAEQIGASEIPAVSRVDSGPISALKWGDADPQVVFLHGGGQNRAHVGHRDPRARPAPRWRSTCRGHGRSAWPRGRRTTGPSSTPRRCGRSCATGRRPPG